LGRRCFLDAIEQFALLLKLAREQVGSSSFEKTDWIQAAKKIDQRTDRPGPACLVAGADARTIVAMEIFEK
jgi:hypothetical protein